MYYYGKAFVELEKTQTRNSTVFTVLIISPSSFLKFLFVFGFSECLWVSFSLLSFENVWLYIWVMVAWLLILRHRWLYVISYTHAYEKSIPKFWERSVKRKSNLIFIEIIKNSFLIKVFYYMVQTFLKILW